jgi:ribonuclease HII
MTGCVPDVVTLGIDEAGRGPVLGPMVMAGVCLRTARAAGLRRAGVTDSKAFGAGEDAHQARLALARRVEDAAESIVIRVVDVAEIDRRVFAGQLNVLEREVAAAIIACSAEHRKIVADGERLFGPLRGAYPNLVARDKGEEFHVAVAAASIVAKVRRDELFACIARRYEAEFGPIAGGGYENAATHRFLRAYVDRYGRLPPEARRSWGGVSAHMQLDLGLGGPELAAKMERRSRPPAAGAARAPSRRRRGEDPPPRSTRRRA